MPDQETNLNFQQRLNVGWRNIPSPIEGSRRENQDNFLIIDANGQARYMQDQQEISSILEAKSWSKGHIRLAVLDGMGGHENGREAAESVVQELLSVPPCYSVEDLSKKIDAIHNRLNKKWQKESSTPGTTLTLLEIPVDGDAMLYHVGDSRLLAITKDKTEVLTIDHVPATQSAIHGQLEEEDWKQQVWYEDRYIIRQAMIMGNALYAPFTMDMKLQSELYPLIDNNFEQADFLKNKSDRRFIKLQKHTVYLLATDGIWTHEKPWEFLQKIPQFIYSGKPRSMSARVDDIVMEHILAADEEVGGDNTTVLGFELV